MTMTMRSGFLLILFCAVSTASMARNAEELRVYRWTDSAGVTHFSDKPPAGPTTSLKVFSLPPLPAPSPSEEAANRAWIEQANRRADAMIKADRDYRLKLAKEQAEAEARRASHADNRPENDDTSIWGYPTRPFQYWIPHWHPQHHHRRNTAPPPSKAARAVGAEDARQRTPIQPDSEGRPSRR